MITRASGRGRRLFTRRRSRWAGLFIWVAVLLGALCLIGAVVFPREPGDALTLSCVAVAAAAMVCGLLVRMFANRT